LAADAVGSSNDISLGFRSAPERRDVGIWRLRVLLFRPRRIGSFWLGGVIAFTTELEYDAMELSVGTFCILGRVAL